MKTKIIEILVDYEGDDKLLQNIISELPTHIRNRCNVKYYEEQLKILNAYEVEYYER